MVHKTLVGKRLVAILLCTISLLLASGIISNPETQAQTAGNFRLDLVNWQGIRSPGAENVPLQIQLVNLHNQSIVSVLGTLTLPYPFTDSTDGDENASDIAETLSTYINVSQYIVLKGEPFELLFDLDIDVGATKGNYLANLTLDYRIIQGNSTVLGVPIEFPVILSVPNSAPVITWQRPMSELVTVEPGEQINFTIIPNDLDNDSLDINWEVDDIPSLNSTDNSFLFTSQSQVGIQKIDVTVSDPNETITETWWVETQYSSETKVAISTQQVIAGKFNVVQVNATNPLWVGKVEASVQAPPPIIVEGNATRNFVNLTEGAELSFKLRLYVPESALGSTGALTLQFAFSDQFGTDYVDSITIGTLVKGFIQLEFIASDISQSAFRPGDPLIVSATILNIGNSNAKFTNTTILSSEGVLIASSSSRSYLGDVEPDSPLPFTLNAFINASASPGDYLINCTVSYTDDIYQTYSISVTFAVQIQGEAITTSEATTPMDFVTLISQTALPILIGGTTLFMVGYIIVRFRRR
ncbi:MAG: hypothetical protein ACFFE8_12310 [Candidatus Heimdallarchaeota archaeon]